ncbi:hypothetical protein HELRODRAFT_78187, partial [Helobdella robusta]|uniref:Guanylate cyclase n=1 Tax=Helobdella robusta TaxID=6412 RepID=T1G391_HELRO
TIIAIIIIIAIITIIAIIIITVIITIITRKARFETSLLVQSWKLSYSDIEMVSAKGSKKGSSVSVSMKYVCTHGKAYTCLGTATQQQIFSDVGYYRGVLVAIKHIRKEHVQVSREILLEFNQLKDIAHDNLNVFVGACTEPPNICLVWHYCNKGSIQDIIMNDEVKLDAVFKLSFLMDIAKGMIYMHKSHLHSHGNLKSSNCLVDSRWLVRITDYGLPSFSSGQFFDESEQDAYRRKLWTAPELLRENIPPKNGSQKGDVYSFAIVAYEIITRSEPFPFDLMTARDAVNRVRNGESIPFRPCLPETTDVGKAVLDLLRACWHEVPEHRPNFNQVRTVLKRQANGEINIMDSVLNLMEKYAYNLEEIVEERTQQLLEEKKKTDRLLYRMLPSTVAEQLKIGRTVKPESYDQATVYFSDIVGFATLASDSNPMQIVDFLNDLYSCFDVIIAQHDVYKVETIGDAYMVVSGVPVRNGQRHAAEIANVSLDLLSSVLSLRIRHRPNIQIQLRVGIHTGPVVAGVVGLTMPRYCLFGDTVNMAARMESSGKPLHIHVSKQSYIAISEIGGYEMTLRGEMNVKGKGLQTTYWLHGKAGYTKPLPPLEL